MNTGPGRFMVLKVVWLRIRFLWNVKLCPWVPTFRRIVGDTSTWRHYDPSKDPEQLTQRQGVTSQKAWKFSCKNSSQINIQITLKVITMTLNSDYNGVYLHTTNYCNNHAALTIHLVTTNFRKAKRFRFCHFKSKYYFFYLTLNAPCIILQYVYKPTTCTKFCD